MHVAGAVRRPGVYTLRAGARVDDAVARAGGATRRADLGGLNLAAEVEDGRQVLVPARAARRGRAAAGGAAAAPAEGQPLNLNTATLEQLDTLTASARSPRRRSSTSARSAAASARSRSSARSPGSATTRLATLREEVTL